VRRTFYICVMVVAVGVCAFARQPIATISSSSSFELDGSLVNIGGVPAWPLMPGARVAAKSSPVVIAMRDGSRITIAANSQIQFDSSVTSPSANLIAGSMQFTLASGSNLRILQGGTPVNGRSSSVGSQGDRALLRPPPPSKISAR